ncbi:MAG: CBS domain-containing protein [Candidatus Levybacteria bacterium]|nr:CBS domain-containing protein [Candidatus Levybacteria bacterium]
MVVSDVMSRAVDYVTTNATVKDISRIIFGKSINGVPVVESGKVVGFITERDILSKFYPSVQDYMEDPVNTSDFESMEKEISNILSMKASKIMSKHPITVTADTPLLKAQSLMFINKVGRLPVVDENNKLIGIVSKSDIFRAVVGDQIPTSGEEEYHDWVSRHYDLATGWEGKQWASLIT